MSFFKRIASLLLCFFITISFVPGMNVAKAVHTTTPLDDILNAVVGNWMGDSKGFIEVTGRDIEIEWPWGGKFSSTVPQKYYTTPTSSVQDKNGNVTNYYRGGDTTTTNIIDSYNKTFNTIHNTTNNTTTNNYKANVKLENFLNQYTTNNNNYTYSADFKSWYYDNTTNNYNFNQFTKNDYTQNNLYYNQDNSRYYISIDNSTDEYYLIDVQ